MYDADSRVLWMYEYTYDNRGNRTRNISYAANLELIGWTEYEFDEQGNEVKVTRYSDEGVTVSTWHESTYDIDGYERERTNYHGDGHVMTWNEFTYDEQMNLIKQQSNRLDGSIGGWEEDTYDERGNELSMYSYAQDRKLTMRIVGITVTSRYMYKL